MIKEISKGNARKFDQVCFTFGYIIDHSYWYRDQTLHTSFLLTGGAHDQRVIGRGHKESSGGNYKVINWYQ